LKLNEIEENKVDRKWREQRITKNLLDILKGKCNVEYMKYMEHNNEMDDKDIRWEDVDWIGLV
jgi:hypothetical protein